MDSIKRQTIVVLVDNEAGVLSQVTRLFSRKGYNIETLAVGATERPASSFPCIRSSCSPPRSPFAVS